MGPKPGYWRVNNSTYTFIKCLYVPSCLGIVEPDYNPMGTCLEGYGGIMCSDCNIGYSRTGSYECGICPHPVANILRLGAVFFIFIFGIIFLIRSTLKGALEKKNVTSIYTKILFSHL